MTLLRHEYGTPRYEIVPGVESPMSSLPASAPSFPLDTGCYILTSDGKSWTPTDGLTYRTWQNTILVRDPRWVRDHQGVAVEFPGETLHGPAPRPAQVREPRVHVLGGDAYAATQTDDEIVTGDILVVPGVAVGVMVEAWPILVHGDGESTGFGELSADADLASIGQERWGRMFDYRYFPHDGPADGLPAQTFYPVRGGYDLRRSFEIARAIPVDPPVAPEPPSVPLADEHTSVLRAIAALGDLDYARAIAAERELERRGEFVNPCDCDAPFDLCTHGLAD